MKRLEWVEWAREIFALRQAGLTYGKNEFDIERYHRLQNVMAHVLNPERRTAFD